MKAFPLVERSVKMLYELAIKYYRHKSHMSQEELAYKVGVSQAYIAMLEQSNITRKKSPKLSLIADIALALEVCPNKIMRFSCTNCSLNTKCDDVEKDINLGFYI